MTETKNENFILLNYRKKKAGVKKIDFWYIVKDTYKNGHKFSENT